MRDRVLNVISSTGGSGAARDRGMARGYPLQVGRSPRHPFTMRLHGAVLPSSRPVAWAAILPEHEDGVGTGGTGGFLASTGS